jgi:hypothetical protein
MLGDFKGLILKSTCKKQKIKWLVTAEHYAMAVAEERYRTLMPVVPSCSKLTGAEEQLAAWTLDPVVATGGVSGATGAALST